MTFYCFCSLWGLFYSKELHTWLNSLNRVNVVQIKPQFKHFMLFLFFKTQMVVTPPLMFPKVVLSSILLLETYFGYF